MSPDFTITAEGEFNIEFAKKRIKDIIKRLRLSLIIDGEEGRGTNGGFLHYWATAKHINFNAYAFLDTLGNVKKVQFLFNVYKKEIREELKIRALNIIEESFRTEISITDGRQYEDAELNSKAYKYLYVLENQLRSFLEKLLRKTYGDNWINKGIPPDVLESCKKNKESESKVRWIESTSKNILSYSNFSDLRKIIEMKENWNSTFKAYFKPKDIVLAKLTELEKIRNKIAHNRPLTMNEFEKIKLYTTELLRLIHSDTSTS